MKIKPKPIRNAFADLDVCVCFAGHPLIMANYLRASEQSF